MKCHDTTESPPCRLTAVISGLKLEGEIKELQTSMQYREKVRAPLKGNVLIEASVIGNMQAWNNQQFWMLTRKI